MNSIFVATNPRTQKTYTLHAKSKQDFILKFVSDAPSAGWQPNDVRDCVQGDMIKEVTA